jgi:hypothetical protein
LGRKKRLLSEIRQAAPKKDITVSVVPALATDKLELLHQALVAVNAQAAWLLY